MKTFYLLISVFVGFISANEAGNADNRNLQKEENKNEIATYDTIEKRSKIILDGAAIEKNAQLINLVFDDTRKVIKLNSTELIEDDAPASGLPEGYDGCCGKVAWIEDLKKGVVVKKILKLDNPAARAGRIVFSGLEVPGNTSTLHISLNGEKIERRASRFAYPGARQYFDPAMYWDHWYFVDIPVKKLKKGDNEILFWTDSDSTSWRILVADEKEYKRGSLDRTSPNLSLKSSDGGKTWNDSKLGALDEIDGEYSIRMSLDRFLPSGEYASSLIDVVNGDSPVKKLTDNIKVTFKSEFQQPAQTAIKSFFRSGATAFVGDETWTEWKPVTFGKEYSLGNKNYLQWKAELSTTDLLVTPSVRSLQLSASWESRSPNQLTGLSVKTIQNGEIINPSYSYSYENFNHPELKRFRDENKLDKVIAGASSEFEIILKLLHWAYRVPITNNGYSWNWNDAIITSPELAMTKLNDPYSQRRRDGMCLFSTQGLIGALLSMGYQARHVNINSEAVNGHEITEVWSNDFNKWVYLDPTLDTYYFDLVTGIPLNVLDLHKMLVAKVPAVEKWDKPFAVDYGKQILSEIKVGLRQGINNYSIATSPGENGGIWALETIGRFRIIPRNDFLSHPLPVPVHTGATSWGWDGFLNWYDDKFPKREEFQNYSNRATDFYQPINQAKIFLNETADRGTLEVNVQHFTPGGFEGLLVSTDAGEWALLKETHWIWKLKNGKNTIKVRTKNSRGIMGPVSEMEVNYNP